ncbi:tyrosine-type recombinase/integrase [Alteromonas ponticola]|uniref:Tyrosine-type recombinase/integrase n=1 Tax=Alteromonas aquimaris TaxID=2998417 RepID=A0ABT3P5N0_9ALTE|nr:tyrosine-type recombinase/integrase [Alteromonas aquimaris]MCW8108081.1 tyrosine-type recombinase/integrase [Alteromonas aquimaris]
MPRNVTALNATQIKQAKPQDKEYNLADGKGLALRVKPNGSKLWLFNYTRPHTKKRSNISIGSYPEISLAEAREARESLRKLLVKDIDPKDHRDSEKVRAVQSAETTFESVARKWFVVHSSKVADGTLKNIKRSFKNDIFPYIGKVPIESLTAPRAIEVLNKIIERGSHEIARKVARRMNSVMTYAVNAGIIHHNPLIGIKELIPITKVKHQLTLPPEELPALMKALRYSSAKITTRCLIEFQLHTMVRPGEAAEAKWAEIDFKEAIWAIPAERMKMDRQHLVPLTPQVIELLELMKPISFHREYIFPSHIDPKRPANRQSANKALRDMGFRDRLVAHGMRALASTILNEQGFDHDVIEAALAHKDENEVRAAYNRAQYLQRRREMMEWWSRKIKGEE